MGARHGSPSRHCAWPSSGRALAGTRAVSVAVAHLTYVRPPPDCPPQPATEVFDDLAGFPPLSLPGAALDALPHIERQHEQTLARGAPR